MTDFSHGRHAGILLPLSSMPSTQSWGIGEVPDLVAMGRWLREAGFDFLQLLPVNEMPSSEHSPYAAVSAMAIDPIYVSLAPVLEFAAAGGEAALDAAARAALDAVRGSRRVEFQAVRALRLAALRRAFERFVEVEWRPQTARAAALSAYLQAEAWWLDDYTLFRALRERYEERPWWDWPPELARRDPEALADARAALERERLFYGWVQWLADTEWRAARAAIAPVGLFGDLPFMVGADSADVWARQHAFRLDATVGTPPDAFSETGQDWGLPAYRWDVFAREDDQWIRDRARRAAELVDGFRVDHLVGYYRTYLIPRDGSARFFSPATAREQLRQGERVMRAFASAGARVIAEDLGTVPDFVRASIARLGIPGYKVLRWERDWHAPGHPFRDPLAYPRVSVATSSTHDTETLAEWWEAAPEADRRLLASLDWLAGRQLDVEGGRCDAATRDALLELLVASRSDFVILPMQDVFGWRDRINTPATRSPDNWTWRLPWPVDRLLAEPEARERASTLRVWVARHGRAR